MKSLTRSLSLLFFFVGVAQADGEQFMQNLKNLCGSKFQGEMTYPEDGQDDFAGKLLVATLSSCVENEVRIPFVVGEDKSRTWIVSATADGLQLKHDHRHKDGTPDKITNYGGTVHSVGTPYSQSFPADGFTARLIPEAATNVWTLTFSKDFSELTYHLTRHDKPRFTAVLTRVPSGS